MKKIGITGVNGFLGRHLSNSLLQEEKKTIVPFHRKFFENESKLDKFVKQCDVIVHLAGLNRSHSDGVIYKTNVRLTNLLLSSLDRTGVKPHIIFASSTQEYLENPYGESKKTCRLNLEKWSQKNKSVFTGLIIPNVFGPFGAPFYNSFISTFSYQLINNELPIVSGDSEVNLIYIDELVLEIRNIINHPINDEFYQIKASSTRTVGEVFELLRMFKDSYIDNDQIPEVGLGTFELKLFNTFRSYISKETFPKKYIQHTDSRGSFVEIIRANTAGQSSYSTTLPGVTRGNHYHTRKIERFAVISGLASIKLRKIDSEKVTEYLLDGRSPSYVDIPVWYTHNITNIGNTELVTLFWISEPYNSEDPDTFFVDV